MAKRKKQQSALQDRQDSRKFLFTVAVVALVLMGLLFIVFLRM
ncbi:MAG: hypothetical protein RLY31_1233 [Bacteroidota bacterium]|jgi:hypothetical protein